MPTNQELRKLAGAAAKFGPHDPSFDMSDMEYIGRAMKANRAFADVSPPTKVIELLDRIDRLEAENEAKDRLLERAQRFVKSSTEHQIGNPSYEQFDAELDRHLKGTP